MRRTIPILRGLAILGVIINHANWQVLSQFAPGQAGGYPYIMLDQIVKFAIPAFMFISGYFVSYATSGGRRDLSWSFVRTRLDNLLWPWLIWSAVMLTGRFLQGNPISVGAFFYIMFVQFYFVPLLIFYYLLAPYIAGLARQSTPRLLLTAVSVQLLAVVLFYLRVYWSGFPSSLNSWVDLGPLQYLRFAAFFPIGLIAGMHSTQLKAFLDRYRNPLWALAAVCFSLSVIEAFFAFRLGADFWPKGGDQTKLSSALFSLALLLSFVSLGQVRVRGKTLIIKLGSYSYGLYLSHYMILGGIAELVGLLAPRAFSIGWLLLPFLVVTVLALALLLQEGVARFLGRRFYRFLFG